MRHRLRSPIVLLAALAVAVAMLATSVFAVSNIDPVSKFAWGENTGWLNSNPSGGGGGNVAASSLTGYVWGENAGWISLNCSNNATCGTVNYGVTNDGAGNLKGMGWGENIGWVNFSCQTNALCGGSAGNWGVTIDPGTGDFHGQAWGENSGWIRFNCADAGTCGTISYKTKTTWTAAACPTPGDCDHDMSNVLFANFWGDGCKDIDEPVLVPPTDPANPWDFYSVPVPALFAALNPLIDFRDNQVTPSDAQAIFAYFKKNAMTGSLEYEQDLNANGVKDGIEYDRSIAGPGISGPPDGIISPQDAQLAFAQFKRSYSC